MSTPGNVGRPGKWPAKNGSSPVRCQLAVRRHPGLDRGHLGDEKERWPVRQDVAGSGRAPSAREHRSSSARPWPPSWLPPSWPTAFLAGFGAFGRSLLGRWPAALLGGALRPALAAFFAAAFFGGACLGVGGVFLAGDLVPLLSPAAPFFRLPDAARAPARHAPRRVQSGEDEGAHLALLSTWRALVGRRRPHRGKGM